MSQADEIKRELAELRERIVRAERRELLLRELADCQRLRRQCIDRGDVEHLAELAAAESSLREAIALWQQRGELW